MGTRHSLGGGGRIAPRSRWKSLLFDAVTATDRRGPIGTLALLDCLFYGPRNRRNVKGLTGARAWNSCGGRGLGWLRAAAFAAISFAALLVAAGASPGHAVEAVNVRTDVTAIDLTGVIDLIKTETDTIQVSAAPGADGIVRRMQQSAREGSTNWAVFALSNSGDEQIDRLIGVPHYRMAQSYSERNWLGNKTSWTTTTSSRPFQWHRGAISSRRAP